MMTCAFWACTTQPEEHIVCDRVLEFRSEAAPRIPERIGRVEYLPLEFSASAAFRNIDKLVFRNDLIYIGDFFSHKIVVYDSSGRIAFVVDRRGRGRGEYLELKSFTVDNDNIYTIDNFTGQVNSYDCCTGEFRGSKKLPVVAWDLEALGNGDFLLAFVPVGSGTLKRSQPDYLIFITDRNFMVKRRLFRYAADYREPFGRSAYFTSAGDSIVFSSFRFDGYTVFDRNDAARFYHVAIDFERKLPDPVRRDGEAVLNSSSSYLVSTPVLCGDCVSVDVSSGDIRKITSSIPRRKPLSPIPKPPAGTSSFRRSAVSKAGS